MSKDKKVIVILQSYNGEKYLRQCIESVLNQTYTNFVFYVIDNASKDSSPQIIREYADKDDRIIPILCDDNIYARWSYLMDDWDDDCYFTIIDHDDLWLPGFLEILVLVAEKANLDMAVCSRVKLLEDNKTEPATPLLKDLLIVEKKNIPQIYWELRQYFYPIFSNIVKVKTLKKVKFKAEELIEQKVYYNWDVLFNISLVKYCDKIGIVNKNLYIYRLHQTNSVKQLNNIQFSSTSRLILEGRKFIKETNYYNQMVEARFQRFTLLQLEGMFRNIENANAKPKEKIKVYMDFCTNKTIVPYLKNIGANAIQFELLQYLYKMIGVVSRHGDEEDKKSLDKFLKKIL